MLQTLHQIQALREHLKAHRHAGEKIALVPTMGNLHSGHITLVKEALKHADIVVTSIFVNPLQFGVNEDLDSYPRTLAEDQAKLLDAGCHYLFAPSDAEMYPHGRELQTRVEVPGLSDLYCGQTRPGHFSGVATVVCKLLNIVQPDLALFGEKDYQQLRIIRTLVRDLSLGVEIQGVPIVRAESGLALSSRNGYLSNQELEQAPALYQTLLNCADQLYQGVKDFAHLQTQAKAQLSAAGFKPDYFHILRQQDMQPAHAEDQQLVLIAAAYLGPARLIDNLEVNL
ncbi:pantoate--beta-alanine ligase [Nitrincola tapanii]|uniref:Pantothenate synthetase n=1 Tax=Nitrincola tapanii TaxID=1708751 RepID=A0A5A9VYQ1_9GAMM|nr:pantoate--beta-alanine ligase [Nitrincola tapanii]KAA0873667.1 pantoate--beta-alanine ligase [Nitrincola tapanii]